MYLLNVTAPAVAAGATAAGLTISVPVGVQRITGLYFNTMIAYDININRSKGSKDAVVENFRTSIGGVGYVPLKINHVSEEVFQISLVNQSGGVADLNIALVAE